MSRTKIATILLSLCALPLLTSCGESTAERSMLEPATSAVSPGEMSGDAETRTMVVYGMSCPLCATNVDKQLMKLDGVQKVSVNLNTGIILVDVDPANAPTTEQLKKAVVDSGFTLKEIDE